MESPSLPRLQPAPCHSPLHRALRASSVWAGYRTPPAAGWPSAFHVITAWNPKRIVPEPENHAADTRLRTQLEQEQIVHFRVTGCSADLAHQEASWGVIGISLGRAIEIGRQYGQNAIFEVLNGEAFVVSCDNLERQSIGQFQDRLKDSSNEQQPLKKQSMSSEEMFEALKKAFQVYGPTARIRRSTPEPSDTTTRRFTFRPYPETPQKEKTKRAPKEPPLTLEILRTRLTSQSLQERVDLVSGAHRERPSLFDNLSADQVAELVGVEFFSDPDEEHKWEFAGVPEEDDYFDYHRASLTLLTSEGSKIVFSTKYNDVESHRYFSI
jgi:hypothetical protein